jgi:hypothetical protein
MSPGRQHVNLHPPVGQVPGEVQHLVGFAPPASAETPR